MPDLELPFAAKIKGILFGRAFDFYDCLSSFFKFLACIHTTCQAKEPLSPFSQWGELR